MYEGLTGEGEKGVNIHGRAHCTYNSEYHNANKDILVLKVWEQGKEGEGDKTVNKEERIVPKKSRDIVAIN